MKNLIFAFLAAAAVAAQGSIADARAAFEQNVAESFARSVLLAAEVAPDPARYDKAPDKASYLFALPYSSDFRLRFINATFDGGKFVDAKLKVLGFEPKSIGEAEFAALRRDFPMVSVRTGTDDVNPTAVFYAATGRPRTRLIGGEQDNHEDPIGYFLGALGGSLGRIGVSTAKLAYRVTVTSKGGQSVDCGIATARTPLNPQRMQEAIRRGIEKADPKRKGQVSERDIVDFRTGGTASYEPAAVPKAGR